MTLLSRSWRGRFGRRVRRVTAAALGPVLAAAGAAVPAVPAVAVAAGVTAAAAAASVAAASPAHAQSGQPVLVLAQNGEATAPETTLLQAAGYAVTQVTPSVWAGMSTAAFEGYAALVIGDPSSGGSCSSLLPTTGTSGSDALGTVWQGAVNGNVAVLGTAPALPGTTDANSLITDSAGYAVAGWNSAGSGSSTSGTGLYVSLNCEYSTAAAGTAVSLLNGVEGIGTDGGLTVQGGLACTDPGTVNTWEAAKAGTFTGFTGGDLAVSAWGTACPVQEGFGSWPAMFTPVAYDSAANVTDDFTASDGTTGQPYVLLGAPVSSATAALAPSEGGEVLGGTTSGGTSNPAAPGVDQAAAGDPVNTENGDFTQSDTDLSLPGFGPSLDFSRTYDAGLAQQQTQTQTPGPMGYGWTDNWATSLSTARPTPGDIYAADGLRLDSGNGALSQESLLNSPQGVYWDSTTGDVYIADTADNRIEEIPATSKTQWGIVMTAGDIYTVAGQPDGQEELPLDQGHANGVPATSIVLNQPHGITMDPGGDLIIADTNFSRIVEIAASNHTQWNNISMQADDAYTIAGELGENGQGGLGGAATSAELVDPTSVHMGQGSGANDLYIADGSGDRILVVPGESESSEWGPSETWQDGYLYEVAGDGAGGDCGNGSAATGACLTDPQGVTINGTNMYIADSGNNRIEEDPATSTSSQWGVGTSMTKNDLYKVAGGTSCGGDTSGSKAIGDNLCNPTSVRDPNGNLYIADSGNNDIAEVAGSGHSEWGLTMTADDLYSVNGWSAPADPSDLWVDSSGNVYVALTDWEAATEMQAPDPNGILLAGGASGHNGEGASYLTLLDAGDGGAGLNASLRAPTATATDSHGDVYIADAGNQRVQEVAAYTHTQFGISMTAGDTYTIASGTGGAADTNPAAVLLDPVGLAVSSSGSVYIADASTFTVDVLDPAGNLSVFAGTYGDSGTFSGNGTAADDAVLSAPSAVAVDGAGDVFFADSGNNEVLEVPVSTTSTMTAGDIYAIAGAAATTPSGLKVTGTTSSSVSLSWKASTGTVSGYAVYENGATTPAQTTSGTTATVTGLSPSTTYTFTVAALGPGGAAGPPSSSVQATTGMLPPGAPTGLAVTTTTDNSVSLSWTAPSGTVSGYDVYENGGSTSVATSTSTSVTVTGLSASTTYTFTVAAYNSGGPGTPSSSVSATTAPAPPAAPTGLTVTGTTSSSVSLSWTAPSGPVSGYYVDEVTEEFGIIISQTQVASVTGTTATVTGLSKSTSYTFDVAAWNAGGTSTSYSSTVTAETAAVSVPAAPTGLTVTGTTSSSVSLSWTAPSGTVTGYDVYENGGSTSVATSTSTSVTVSGLSASTTYTFTVAAYNSAGTGTQSSSVSATTVAPPPAPAAPTGLTVTGTTSSSVSLSWTAPSGTVTGYDVYENGGSSSVATSTSTSVTVSGLSASTPYTFTVAAYNAGGTSTPSSSVSATTSAASSKPAAPTNFTATLNSNGTSASLSWTAPSGTVTGYIVYEEDCEVTGCGGTLSELETVSGTSVTVSGLAEFDEYGFAVAAYNSAGTGAQTSEVYVETGFGFGPVVGKSGTVTLLATPAGLSATPASADTVKLTWTKAAGTAFSGYYVYENGTEITTVSSPKATSATISGLAPGTKYKFTIAEYDGASTSAVSGPATSATPSGSKSSGTAAVAALGSVGDPYGGTGNGGPATAALLDGPSGVAVDAAGNIYISDSGNDQIREIAAVTGAQHGQPMTAGDIYDIAGDSATTVTGAACPAAGVNGDGGPAVCAVLSDPQQIAVDQAGDVYIADSLDSVIREVPAASGGQWSQSMTTGNIYDIVGEEANPGGDSTGDGAPAATDFMNLPYGVATDPYGDVFVLQQGGGANGLLPQLQEITATAAESIPPGTGQTSSLFPLDQSPQDNTGYTGGGITISQPGDSQVTFYAELGTGGCAVGEYQAGNYCLSDQDTGATLASSSGGWVYTPSSGGDSYTYPLGGGQMTAETDNTGDTLTITQDDPAPGSGACPSAATSCATIQAATGRTLTIGYGATSAPNGSGLITSVTDPMGRTWNYTYNSADQLISTTDPMTNVTSYAYGPGNNTNQDLANDLLTITSPNGQPGGPDAGKSTVNVYDELGRVTSQTDPMGFKTTFNYCVDPYDGDCMDASGSGLVTVTDPDNNKTVYQYQLGTLTAESQFDASAATPTSENDYNPLTAAGVPFGGTLLDASRTDGDGNTVTFSYDSAGDPTTITAPGTTGPAVTTAGFTSNGNFDNNCQGSTAESASATCAQDAGPAPVAPGGAITPPSGSPPVGLEYALYDTDGNELYDTTGVYGPGSSSASYVQTTYQLFNGNTVTLNGVTDSCAAHSPVEDLPCATINADGIVTQIGYDSDGDVTSSATPDGNGSEQAITTYSYDPDGEQTSTTAPDGNLSSANAGNYTTVTAYNNDGQRTSVTSAGGSGATVTPRPTAYAYDGNGNMTAVTDARGFMTKTVYNADDKVTLTTDPDGDATLTCYNGDGYKSQVVPPAGVASAGLTPASCPTSYPAGDSQYLAPDATITQYNARNQVVEVDTPAPPGQSGHEVTTYTYDGNGNVTSESTPSASTGGAPQVTVNTYGAAGQVLATTTGYGTASASTTQYCYDPADDRTAVIAGDGDTSGIAPCETSFPWVVSAAAYPAQAAYQTTYEYDSASEQVSDTRPATAAAPAGATSTSVYDPAGNLTSSTDPDNVTVTYAYTPLGQVASAAYSGNAAHPVSYVYDADGVTTSMTDATGTSTYIYDPFGRVTSETNGSDQTVSYAYDVDGNVTGVTYPLPASASWATSPTVGYSYDDADRLTSVTDFAGTKTVTTDTPDGLPATVALGSSGDTITTTYGGSDSPASITLANSTSTLQTFAYADAPSGAVLAEADTPAASGYPADYAYDGRGDIASMTPGTGSAVSYSFDASGNLTTLPDGAAASYDHAGELTSATLNGTGASSSYTYDAAGDRLSATQAGTAVSSATWNGAEQLTSYQNSAATMSSAAYDGNGNRATATFTSSGQNPVSETYAWEGDQLLEDSANAYIYAGGTTPVEQVSLSTGTPTYLVADSLGSVRATVSATGAVTGTAAYDAWGNPQAAGGLTAVTPFGYAGGYTDPDGLIYLINRYYDPATGQFISLDPDVDQTQQPYAYAAGNPVNSTDPTGLMIPGGGGGPVINPSVPTLATADRTTAHNLAVQYAIGDIAAQLMAQGKSIWALIGEIKAPYEVPLGKKDYLNKVNGWADIAYVPTGDDEPIEIWEVKSASYGYLAAGEAAWYVSRLAIAGKFAEPGFDLRGVLVGPGTGSKMMIVASIPEGDWGGILYRQVPGRARVPSFLRDFFNFWDGIAAAVVGSIRAGVKIVQDPGDAAEVIAGLDEEEIAALVVEGVLVGAAA